MIVPSYGIANSNLDVANSNLDDFRETSSIFRYSYSLDNLWAVRPTRNTLLKEYHAEIKW